MGFRPSQGEKDRLWIQGSLVTTLRKSVSTSKKDSKKSEEKVDSADQADAEVSKLKQRK